MRFLRYSNYFSRLRALIGFKAAAAFVLAHMGNKLNPPHGGQLASVPVGPYTFYYPSIDYFVGLFTEIFFKETYYLVPTQERIHTIDCGANIGMSLLYIKIRAPRAQVLCCEPNPAARAVLEKNIKANNWEADVRVFPCALGEKKGSVEFFVDRKEATSSGGSVANHLGNRNHELNTYLVEVDMLSAHIDSAVDFLKIDIEGGEFGVLEDLVAKNKLHYIATIQLEYHYIPGFVTRLLSEMLTLLETGGFRTFVQSPAPPHRVVGSTTQHTYMVFAWRSLEA